MPFYAVIVLLIAAVALVGWFVKRRAARNNIIGSYL